MFLVRRHVKAVLYMGQANDHDDLGVRQDTEPRIWDTDVVYMGDYKDP